LWIVGFSFLINKIHVPVLPHSSLSMDKLRAYWASAPGPNARACLRRTVIPVCATLLALMIVALITMISVSVLDTEQRYIQTVEAMAWSALGAGLAMLVYPILSCVLFSCPSKPDPLPDAWFTLVYQRPDKARLLGDVSDWIVPQPEEFENVAQRLARLEGEPDCDYFVRVCIVCNGEDSTESTLE
jgi:hypothetical protein